MSTFCDDEIDAAADELVQEIFEGALRELSRTENIPDQMTPKAHSLSVTAAAVKRLSEDLVGKTLRAAYSHILGPAKNPSPDCSLDTLALIRTTIAVRCGRTLVTLENLR
eukprot:TRINITY_DN6585_c0_g1_i1.p1 TRINITY_DN6585_c0_g1~~TRINITY_DN6585_c0_g1_i1.p1  ORF type:complete len:110 (+),score=3.67 TRINITY_DN6585_c0_g1_i1:120-449(+)